MAYVVGTSVVVVSLALRWVFVGGRVSLTAGGRHVRCEGARKRLDEVGNVEQLTSDSSLPSHSRRHHLPPPFPTWYRKRQRSVAHESWEDVPPV